MLQYKNVIDKRDAILLIKLTLDNKDIIEELLVGPTFKKSIRFNIYDEFVDVCQKLNDDNKETIIELNYDLMTQTIYSLQEHRTGLFEDKYVVKKPYNIILNYNDKTIELGEFITICYKRNYKIIKLDKNNITKFIDFIQHMSIHRYINLNKQYNDHYVKRHLDLVKKLSELSYDRKNNIFKQSIDELSKLPCYIVMYKNNFDSIEYFKHSILQKEDLNNYEINDGYYHLDTKKYKHDFNLLKLDVDKLIYYDYCELDNLEDSLKLIDNRFKINKVKTRFKKVAYYLTFNDVILQQLRDDVVYYYNPKYLKNIITKNISNSNLTSDLIKNINYTINFIDKKIFMQKNHVFNNTNEYDIFIKSNSQCEFNDNFECKCYSNNRVIIEIDNNQIISITNNPAIKIDVKFNEDSELKNYIQTNYDHLTSLDKYYNENYLSIKLQLNNFRYFFIKKSDYDIHKILQNDIDNFDEFSYTIDDLK